MNKNFVLAKAVLLGRSNVGKSTLFNKIAGRRQAIVTALPGTTRDRLEAEVSWQGKNFLLIDTGGLDPSKDDVFRQEIIKQTQAAEKEANLLMLVIDGQTGILPADRQIARRLQKTGMPLLIAANKCDKLRQINALPKNILGLPVFPVSAASGSGVGDLLDEIASRIKQAAAGPTPPDFTLALLGKPNTGKSSLLNSLSGQERMIVSPLPFTTRDSQAVLIKHKIGGQNLVGKVIDTAGVRRRVGTEEIEELSVAKSLRALNECDIAALVLDISQKLTWQDKHLADLAGKAGKGLLLVANKWDLIPEKNPATLKKYENYLARTFPFLNWAPVIFISALAGQRARSVLELAWELKQNMDKTVPQPALDDFLPALAKKRSPLIGKGTRRPKLLKLTQTRTNPPAFQLLIPMKTMLAKSYEQFLLNSLRKEFDFEGIPLGLRIRQSQERR